MNQIETLKDVLSQSGYSTTKSRLAVFEQLAKTAPLSAADLADNCLGVNRSTTYRCLLLFEKLGIVKQIWIGFRSQYELTDRFDPHHHHISCLNCQRVFNIKNPQLERLLHSISARHGVAAEDHQVEINGYCRNCR